MNKIYTSKKNRKFAISNGVKPPDGDVVFFTKREFDWCKQQNLDADQFETIWLLKRDDFRYDPIPEEEKIHSVNIGVRYAQEIQQMLRGRRGA